MTSQKQTPVILQRADPWVYKHTDGFYYFTASVPEYDRIEIRRSEKIEGLAAAEPVTVWRKHDGGPMSKHIWAPELHCIENKWYIYFAAGEAEDIWKIRPYVLECTDKDPMTGAWIEKGMVQKAEGDPFSFGEFSLDATTFEHSGKRYLVWAQKVNGAGGISNLYIAEMSNSWTLATVQVMLTTPDYDWERHIFWVNEGPAVIKRNGRIFISFSASATDYHYCMGLLTASEDADLLDPNSWSKSRWPVLESSDESGLYGPGHSSFTVSEDGSEDLLVYHARPYREIAGDPLYDPNRHTFVKRLKWNADGTPDFKG
jgi:GH43 family beta-xylosidase